MLKMRILASIYLNMKKALFVISFLILTIPAFSQSEEKKNERYSFVVDNFEVRDTTGKKINSELSFLFKGNRTLPLKGIFNGKEVLLFDSVAYEALMEIGLDSAVYNTYFLPYYNESGKISITLLHNNNSTNDCFNVFSNKNSDTLMPSEYNKTCIGTELKFINKKPESYNVKLFKSYYEYVKLNMK